MLRTPDKRAKGEVTRAAASGERQEGKGRPGERPARSAAAEDAVPPAEPGERHGESQGPRRIWAMPFRW